jgi:hypothetical protein
MFCVCYFCFGFVVKKCVVYGAWRRNQGLEEEGRLTGRERACLTPRESDGRSGKERPTERAIERDLRGREAERPTEERETNNGGDNQAREKPEGRQSEIKTMEKERDDGKRA